MLDTPDIGRLCQKSTYAYIVQYKMLMEYAAQQQCGGICPMSLMQGYGGRGQQQ
jgi:hypothetical protein